MLDSKKYIQENSEAITESGCWIWSKYLGSNGYGLVSNARKLAYAHRMSYEAFKGDIPDGMHVLHYCDVRSCVNPFHLSIGTNQDNIMDSVKKGRRKRAYKARPDRVGASWSLSPEICENRRKIKTKTYKEIYKLKEEGWLGSEIAAKYNVTCSLICKILKAPQHD
jgi:hypothetical protein